MTRQESGLSGGAERDGVEADGGGGGGRGGRPSPSQPFGLRAPSKLLVLPSAGLSEYPANLQMKTVFRIHGDMHKSAGSSPKCF